jgi:hypothetical protein
MTDTPDSIVHLELKGAVSEKSIGKIESPGFPIFAGRRSPWRPQKKNQEKKKHESIKPGLHSIPMKMSRPSKSSGSNADAWALVRGEANHHAEVLHPASVNMCPYDARIII